MELGADPGYYLWKMRDDRCAGESTPALVESAGAASANWIFVPEGERGFREIARRSKRRIPDHCDCIRAGSLPEPSSRRNQAQVFSLILQVVISDEEGTGRRSNALALDFPSSIWPGRDWTGWLAVISTSSLSRQRQSTIIPAISRRLSCAFGADRALGVSRVLDRHW